MKKIFAAILVALCLTATAAYAANDWDSGSQKKGKATADDKKAMARNLSAMAKNPEALKAAANVAKVRSKQKEMAGKS